MYVFGYVIQNRYNGKYLTSGWRWSHKIPSEFHTQASATKELKEFLQTRPKVDARVVKLYAPYVVAEPV